MSRVGYCFIALLIAGAGCSDGSVQRSGKERSRGRAEGSSSSTLYSRVGPAYAPAGTTFLRAVTAPGMLVPMRLALGPDGSVVVSDPKAKALFVFSKGGSLAERINLLQRPLGMAVDPVGRYLIGDADGTRLIILSPGGTLPKLFCASAGEFKKPNDIAVNPVSGLVWIVDSGHDRVVVCTSEGIFVRAFGSSGIYPGEFAYPIGVAIDPAAGEVYVSDMNNGRVQVFDEFGVYQRAVASYGGAAGQLARPAGLALDELNRLYVGDLFQSRVQAFDPAGNHLQFIGEPGEGGGQLLLPADLVVDEYKRLHVISQGTRRIEVFGLDGHTDPPDAVAPVTVHAAFEETIVRYGPSIASSYLCIDVPGSDSAIIPSSVRVHGFLTLDEPGIIDTNVKCNGSFFEAQGRVNLNEVWKEFPAGGEKDLTVTGRLRDGTAFAGSVHVSLVGGEQ